MPLYCIMLAAMTASECDRGDPSGGKGGGQDGLFTEQNGRQKIRIKEHQATQKATRMHAIGGVERGN